MLVDVSSKLHEAAVIELLEYAVYSDPDALGQIIEQYAGENQVLYAFEDQGEYVALIGAITDQDKIEIKHLVVRPEDRLKGYGRGTIVELLLKERPTLLQAIADETTVDFFRNLGFQIIDDVGHNSGLELFKCLYHVDDEEEE
ncbi:hypothetical protein D3C77_287300 [compost metagenome]